MCNLTMKYIGFRQRTVLSMEEHVFKTEIDSLAS